MTITHDVLIIGAGQAGAAFGWAADRAAGKSDLPRRRGHGTR